MADNALIAQAMEQALKAASLAATHGDVPIGAAVILDGSIISVAGNRRVIDGDPTAHAELLAIRAAAATNGSSRLDGAWLVSTLEPCPMCAGAAVLARLGHVVFGASDPKAGALGSLYNLGDDPRLNHSFSVERGLEEQRCAALLTKFFAAKR